MYIRTANLISPLYSIKYNLIVPIDNATTSIALQLQRRKNICITNSETENGTHETLVSKS